MNPPSMNVFLAAPDFLQAIIGGAEKNNEVAESLTAELTELQLNWKPSAEQWSIAQCLDHLAVATRGFEKYFMAALAQSRHATAGGPYKPTLLGGWLARQVSPEGARKLPAPKIFRPADASKISGSLAMFLDQQAQFLDFVRRCAQIDYNKTRIRLRSRL